MVFTIAKFIHITLAIIAVGFNASYGVWIARSAREQHHIGFALRTIMVLEDRYAKPAYGLLLLSGLFMAFTAGLPLSTLWIAAALALYFVVAIMAVAVISPNLRRQLATLEADGPESVTFKAAAARGRAVLTLATVLVLAIVFLMVTKPTLG